MGKHKRRKHMRKERTCRDVMEIITAVIAGISAIIVAVIEKRASKDRKRAEKRALVREKESRLSMELMAANCKLSVVTARAVNGMHNNGNVEEAMEAASKAQDEYERFLRDVVSRNVA